MSSWGQIQGTKLERSTLARSLDLSLLFDFGFALWPAEFGICSWTTGATEASCSNSTRATGDE